MKKKITAQRYGDSGLIPKKQAKSLGVVATAPDSCDKAAASRLNIVAKKEKFPNIFLWIMNSKAQEIDDFNTST